MRRSSYRIAARGIALAALLWCTLPVNAVDRDDAASVELDSRRLLGKAYYENDEFGPAATEFGRCIELAPKSAADHFNLGLVLMRATDYEKATHALETAARLDPKMLAPYYVRGIIHKRNGNFAKAITDLEYVIERDPRCVGAYYSLGVCHKYLKQYEQAAAAMEALLRLEPNHPSARYQMITLARRVGDMDAAQRHKEVFDRVKDTVDESEKTIEALERSKYSYIIELPPLRGELAPAVTVARRFVDTTAAANLPGGAEAGAPPAPFTGRMASKDYSEAQALQQYVPAVGAAVVLGDYDADGDLDIYVANCAADPAQAANRLYRNDGAGRFADVTAAAGVGDKGLGQAATFGDYDNDGHLDLYVVNCGANVLYHNRGDGSFTEVSEHAGVDEPQFGRTASFVDYDHDNDLDIVLGNDVALAEPPQADAFVFPDDLPGQANALLRNNGNGTFTDLTDEAGLLVDLAQTRSILYADFDGDDDTDLFTVNANAPSILFANARLGKFTPGGAFTPPLDKHALTAAEGDLNRDGAPDLLIAVGKKLFLYLNDGQANFIATVIELPTAMINGVGGIDLLDYNNDGWTDLLLRDVDGRSLALLAGVGPGRFGDVSAAVGLDAAFGNVADLDLGDVDNDGDQDIVLQTRDHGTRLLTNTGQTTGHWLNVRLVGRKVNRSGHAATVEVASGGHYQKQTVRRGRVHFGLGALETIDVVRVTWPNGVAQNVIRPPIDAELTVEERVKISASCAFLYAYNGARFELINEILGIGPLGVPMAPGVYHQPDCTELTAIGPDQLVARNGKYELRLTEELRETVYADQITLRVVDHPAELEIVPNEMFSAPPFPEDKFYAAADTRLPIAAVDDRGADVLELISTHDQRYPTFPVAPYEGLAQPHSITLDLGDLAGAQQIILFLDAWIYWPESSTVMAIAQDPRFAVTPLSLQLQDDQGRWRTVIESVGLPTSKGLVVPVDLTGRFTGKNYRVRLTTTLCVYFDRVFVATGDQAQRCRVTELPVAESDLHYRGFSAMSRDALGYERFDYDAVSLSGSWNQARGRFTRYGDVTELLEQADDMYAIFGPGDELTMLFDAERLPPLPGGWRRQFIFYANGWVKDGDLNTKYSETVTPLPFHGMSTYPYPPSEHYPRSTEFIRYEQEYNTRPGRVSTGRLAPWSR